MIQIHTMPDQEIVEPDARRVHGFTLIEVMLSLFMVLLLVLGMNIVFTTTSKAVSAGQALNDATSHARAMQSLIFSDLSYCAPDSPVFIINSEMVPAYLNAADAANGAALPTSGCLPGHSLHRLDSITFCARGLFHRKTSNDNVLNSTTTSDEAYEHIGHLATLTPDGITYMNPELASKTAGPFAADWALGRNVILMGDGPNVLFPNAKDTTASKNSEVYFPSQAKAPAPWASQSASAAANVAPFGYNSLDYNNNFTIQSSRFDLAGVTMDQFRGIVNNAYIATVAATTVGATPNKSIPPNASWWVPLVYQGAFTGMTAGSTTVMPPVPNVPATNPPAAFPRYRFQASSLLAPAPTSTGTAALTAAQVASFSPYMLEHVSQFIVEFAGDFVSEDTSGKVTDTVPDGTIDYYFDANNNKQIRWYGMPRDTSGLGHVYRFGGAHINNTGSAIDGLPGVVPLSDIWQTGGNSNLNNSRTTNQIPVPYEVETDKTLLGSHSGVTDYADSTNGMDTISARYTAVWRNDVPAMVRILLKVDDPNNALQDGPWYEYVYRLK